jgi:hypothetical protein
MKLSSPKSSSQKLHTTPTYDIMYNLLENKMCTAMAGPQAPLREQKLVMNANRDMEKSRRKAKATK